MKDTKLLHIFDLIQAAGYTAEYVPLPPDRDSETNHDLKVVRIQHHLTFRPYRSTVAHKAAHVAYGDEPTLFGPVNAKQERRADEWAALHLISASTTTGRASRITPGTPKRWRSICASPQTSWTRFAMC